MPTKIKTLVAEDSMTQAKLMSAMLEQYGVCYVAHDGQEAFKVFSEHLKDDPFDMVFVDLVMPVMDGFGLIKAIRNLEDSLKIGNTPLIITTAIEDMRNLCRAFFDRKNISFISKPVHMSDIKSEICRYLCLRSKFNDF